jgi:ribonucleoside-diphosphate reductase beta chain
MNLDHEEPLLIESRNRFVLHPVQHFDVYQMAENAEEAFWTTGEVDLSKDREDWTKLSKDQQFFIEQVLAFFAASDGIVIENLGMRFLHEVKQPEARYFYGIQVGIETIHSKMYSILIDTYVQNEARRLELFDAINTMPCIKKKADWALKYIDNSESFGCRLLAFACVEGLFFSSSFASIYYIKTLGLLPGLTQSNELIARDEGLHTEFAVLLYTKHVKTKLDADKVHALFREAVAIEQTFVCESLPVRLLGMNQELMCQYVQFVADRLLISLGYAKLWNATNPFDFMVNISTETKTNFFERRVSEYKRANVSALKTTAFSRSDEF